MAKLGEICDILNGYAFKSNQYTTSGVRIIRISNVQKGYIEDKSPVYYPCDDENVKKYELKQNDLLISLTGNVGRTALLEEKFLPAALNQRVSCIRLKEPDKVLKTYLFHLLNSDYFEQQCMKAAEGVAQKNLSPKWLFEYKIPIYSIERQKEISNTLDKIDLLIILRKQQLAKLDELIKAQFVEMFDAKGPAMCLSCVGDYSKILSGFAFKSENFCENETPIIRIGNINDGLITIDRSICYPKDFWDNNPKFRIQKHDILMAMSGATIGKSGISKLNEKLLVNQRVACIRTNDKATARFLFICLRLPWMYKLIQEASAGCAQPNISGKQLANLPVPKAESNQIRSFSAFAECVDRQKQTVQQSLEKLELMKKALMQEYFG